MPFVSTFKITETQYKQFHPDIFHSPWVSVFVKGRIQAHIWAVVIIQRAFRNFIKRKLARLRDKKKVSNTKAVFSTVFSLVEECRGLALIGRDAK